MHGSVILQNTAQAIPLFLRLIMLFLNGACQAAGFSSRLGECSRDRLVQIEIEIEMEMEMEIEMER